MLPLIEGGLRGAEEAQAYSARDEAAALYRSTVLAAAAAENTLKLSMNLSRNGAVSYLDVVVAQIDALDAQRRLLDIETRRLQASVRLEPHRSAERRRDVGDPRTKES